MGLVTAAKTATVVVRNRKQIGKSIGLIVCAVAFPVLAIGASILELVSAFTPEGAVASTNNFDVSNTAVYAAMVEATTPFYNNLWNEMGQKRSEIMSEHTEIVTLVGENGREYEAEKCDVIVTRHLNYLGDAYFVAYLTCAEGIDVDTAEIDKDVAYEFLDSICTMVINENYGGEYEITNTFLSLEEIKAMYFPDERAAKKFRASCEVYSKFMSISSASIDIEAGNWTNAEFSAINLMDVPLYLQYKGAWAAMPYGNGTIRKTGCAPTCLAMVLSYLRQEQILPSDVVAWAGNRYYVNGAGTAWSIFDAVPGAWGVRCTSIGKNESLMLQALRDGKPVIASMGPGTFTKAGHFIVLSGITLDGKIVVKDPNDSSLKDHANKRFATGTILRECKNLWVCE